MLALLNAGFRWHETRPLIKSRRADLSCRSSRVRLFGFTLSALAPVWAPSSSSSRRLPCAHRPSGIFRDRIQLCLRHCRACNDRDNPFREVLCRQMASQDAWRGMALLVCGAVLLGIGELTARRHSSPSSYRWGCRGRYCLHGVRYRERRFGRVRRHRGISGRVLLLRSKPDSQHCRDIGGGTFKR